MIKANELRIGNYYNNFGILKQVTKETFTTVYFNSIQPIKLTEEWLLYFGAKEYLGSKISFKYSRFDLFWREDYKYWYVTDFDNETYLTKIEFVHEFQNFIFVMDGKELTLKNDIVI